MLGDTWHDHVDAAWHPRGVKHGLSHVVHLCEWAHMEPGFKWKEKGKKVERRIKEKEK